MDNNGIYNELLKYYENYKNKIIYSAVVLFLFIGAYLRSLPINKLVNAATGKPLLDGADSFIFYRYINYFIEHGVLMTNDVMRYVPLGYNPTNEFTFISALFSYLYKIFNFLFPVELETFLIFYPVFTFAIIGFLFFLILKKLFDERVALLGVLIYSLDFVNNTRIQIGFADKDPLALIFFFLSLFFILEFVLNEHRSFWSNSRFTFMAIGASIISNMIWGGGKIIFLFVGLLLFFLILTGRISKNLYYQFLLFLPFLFVILTFLRPDRFTFKSPLISPYLAFPMFILIYGGFYLYLINKNPVYLEKYASKFSPQLFSLVFVSFITLLFLFIFTGPSAFLDKIFSLFSEILDPFYGVGRWGRTVSEVSPVFMYRVMNTVGVLPFILFFAGLLLWSYNLIKKFSLKLIKPLSIFAAFLFIFFGSTWDTGFFLRSSNYKLNIILATLLLVLSIFYLIYYSYKKDKEIYTKLSNLSLNEIYIFVFFIFISLVFTSVSRFVFFFSFIFSMFFAYFCVKSFDYFKLLKNKKFRYAGFIFLLLVFFMIPVQGLQFFDYGGYAVSSYTRFDVFGKTYSPLLSQHGQFTLAWINENTPKDSVFASWWDYGYEIQTLGERATISDGGNARGGINYFTARNLLTSKDDMDTLEFLYANNVTHIYISDSDLGKYISFSAIGSDENYDRYSYVLPFFLISSKKISENVLLNNFATRFKLDEDFEFEGEIFLRNSAEIILVEIPVKIKDQKQQIGQPYAVISQGNKYVKVRLGCVYVNDKKIEFPEYDLPGCFFIIPYLTIAGKRNEAMPNVGFYASDKVLDGFLGRYYLLDEQSPYFEKLYENSNKGSRFYLKGDYLTGPSTVLKVNYPDDIIYRSVYVGDKVPDKSADIYKREFDFILKN